MIYYWESEHSSGKFEAPDDETALKRRLANWYLLYRETDTPDGRPFKVLYEHKDEELGKQLIELFDLKVNENGRVKTLRGEKTPTGLVHSVLELVKKSGAPI